VNHPVDPFAGPRLVNEPMAPFLAPAPARAGAGRFCSCLIAVWFATGATFLIGSVSPEAAPYADGAPAGFSGGFKEQSCDGCHFEAAVNTPPGQLGLAGVPARFVAGEKYPLTITLTRPGMKLAGFQLAARFEDGAQAGTLEGGTGEEKRVAIAVQESIQYANHRRPGADPIAPDTGRWTLVWTAPAAARPVTFHVAANAGDGDESTRGDYVYTAVVVSQPQ
jgi:hypothetical protein